MLAGYGPLVLKRCATSGLTFRGSTTQTSAGAGAAPRCAGPTSWKAEVATAAAATDAGRCQAGALPSSAATALSMTTVRDPSTSRVALSMAQP